MTILHKKKTEIIKHPNRAIEASSGRHLWQKNINYLNDGKINAAIVVISPTLWLYTYRLVVILAFSFA